MTKQRFLGATVALASVAAAGIAVIFTPIGASATPPIRPASVAASSINGGTGQGNCLTSGTTGRQDAQTGSLFDGWLVNSPQSYGGIYSDIDTYNPFVDADGDVSAWTALVNVTKAENNGAIWQIGYGKAAGQTQANWFYEVHDVQIAPPFSQNFQVLLGQAATGAHYYTVLYDNAGSTYYTLEIDNVSKFVWHSSLLPSGAQAFGETHDTNDQMVGGITDPVNFNRTLVWNPAGSSGGWKNMNGAPGVNDMPTATGYGLINDSSDTGHFTVWDKQCQQ
ncbi:MAG: hypothetical protein ACR2MY_09650 [Candidatus Dormibacteria bacterium]